MSHVLTPGGTLDTVAAPYRYQWETIYEHTGHGRWNANIGDFGNHLMLRMNLTGHGDGAAFMFSARSGWHIRGSFFNLDNPHFGAWDIQESGSGFRDFGANAQKNVEIIAGMGGLGLFGGHILMQTGRFTGIGAS